MLVSPEALPQEAVEEQARLDLGLASHPFTVQAMHPPKGRHLHPFDWIDTPARLLASRPDTANAWPVVVARLHMHLGPRRTRRPAFRRVGWAGAVPFQRVDERAAGPEEPHRQPLRPACRCPGDRRVAARPEAARRAGLEGGVEKVVTSRNDRRIDRPLLPEPAPSGRLVSGAGGQAVHVPRRRPSPSRPSAWPSTACASFECQARPRATSWTRRATTPTPGHPSHAAAGLHHARDLIPVGHSRRRNARTPDAGGRTADTWTLRRPHRTPVTWTGPVEHRTLASDTGHQLPDTNADTVTTAQLVSGPPWPPRERPHAETPSRACALARPAGCSAAPPAKRRLGALLSSDEFGSSVEREAHGQVLWRAQMRADAVVFSVWYWICIGCGVDGLTAPTRMSALCRRSVGRSACPVDGHTLRAAVA
jgi:hypothetical protein